MERRTFLHSLTLSVFALLAPMRAWAAESMKAVEDLQKNWRSLLADDAKVATPTPPLKRPNPEWRNILTPEQYNVLREHGNMSAPTVLFVLERVLAAGTTGRLAMTAVGPGFTASCVCLSVQGPAT